MKIGIGLPNHCAGVPGQLLVPWARRAEERGFESVTTIDRLIYPSVDSIIALALAAGATSDLTLVTNILLAPLYPPVLLAKQLGSLADAAGGRLAIGIGVGSREDDYTAVGVDYRKRGKLLDDQVPILRRAWAGEEASICPAPVDIPLLFGGRSDATVRRATTVGDGWVAGALREYEWQSSFADRVRAAWRDAGRLGQPQIQASVNFAFGDDVVVQTGRDHLARYYGFKPEYAQLNVDDMVATPADAQATARAYRDMGFDRLLFHPTVAEPDQVDRLADAVL
jgi:alkanesulfonate monooxygenase SsuD/methylene tetrahydromethanopterin reductase-like flavin-dependent oxidoreductase (luciferase family)